MIDVCHFRWCACVAATYGQYVQKYCENKSFTMLSGTQQQQQQQQKHQQKYGE